MRACVVLSGSSMPELLQKAYDAKQRGADLVEVHLNAINDYNSLELIESFPLPVIVSCNCTKKQETIAALKKALKFRTEFVDIDIGFPKSLIDETFFYARANGIKTIISYYPETVPMQKTLKKVIEDMAILSGYIKIVLPAKSKKGLEYFDGIFAISEKTGAKLTLINSIGAEEMTDKRNFIGYGKTESSSHNRHLPQIENVKKAIIENMPSESQ